MKVTSISGIRGVIGKDFTSNEFIKIGRSFGDYISGGVCAIGRDTRITGPMISYAVISGLLSRGCNVLDMGITSTPSIFREVLREKISGGLVITASHNPEDWNGIKFVIDSGRGFFQEELDQFLKILSLKPTKLFKTGIVYPTESHYPEDIIRYVGVGSCSNLKVVIDPGGGSGSIFVPKIFKELGCNILTVNALPGVFSREIDPTKDNLTTLTETVKTSSADIGIAYDCDADRVVFIDNNGKKLDADFALLLYLKYLVDSGNLKNIVVSVDTTSAVDEIFEGTGKKVIRSKVGEANVVQLMIDKKISIGGEGSSGGLIISDFNFCRDGVLASAIIASSLTNSTESLADKVNNLPKYFNLREKMNCGYDDAVKIIKILSEEKNDDINTLDGLKINKSKRSWILIRPSNTENIIRISVEAKTEDYATELMTKYKNKISKILDEGF